MNQALPAVPLCDARASYERHQHALDAALKRVLASGQAILGPEVAAFEREFADFCNVKYAIGCSSGSDALLLALAALDIGEGDEVIVPPFTFFATAGAVCRAGATPIFVDVDPTTQQIDASLIEEHITARTKAIMPVHLFGACARMDRIRTIAEQYRLHVIEDAAQACGAEFQGERAGSMGAVGCFSFYPTKTLGAFGDAGIVTTNDAVLAERLASLRVHGMRTRYHHSLMGWNARLDAVHAAMLRVKLPFVADDIAARRKAARRYDRMFRDRGLTNLIQTPELDDESAPPTFNQYVVHVRNGRRDELLAELRSQQIGCEVYYPIPLHLQECLSSLGHRRGDFPVSESLCERVLALPMFPEITEDQQRRVVDVMSVVANRVEKVLHAA